MLCDSRDTNVPSATQSLGDAEGRVLASMLGSAFSASSENLKPHVNSSPQKRTCRACFAPVFIVRIWVQVCLLSRTLCQASMQRAEVSFSAWRGTLGSGGVGRAPQVNLGLIVGDTDVLFQLAQAGNCQLALLRNLLLTSQPLHYSLILHQELKAPA